MIHFEGVVAVSRIKRDGRIRKTHSFAIISRIFAIHSVKKYYRTQSRSKTFREINSLVPSMELHFSKNVNLTGKCLIYLIAFFMTSVLL